MRKTLSFLVVVLFGVILNLSSIDAGSFGVKKNDRWSYKNLKNERMTLQKKGSKKNQHLYMVKQDVAKNTIEYTIDQKALSGRDMGLFVKVDPPKPEKKKVEKKQPAPKVTTTVKENPVKEVKVGAKRTLPVVKENAKAEAIKKIENAPKVNKGDLVEVKPDPKASKTPEKQKQAIVVKKKVKIDKEKLTVKVDKKEDQQKEQGSEKTEGKEEKKENKNNKFIDKIFASFKILKSVTNSIFKSFEEIIKFLANVKIDSGFIKGIVAAITIIASGVAAHIFIGSSLTMIALRGTKNREFNILEKLIKIVSVITVKVIAIGIAFLIMSFGLTYVDAFAYDLNEKFELFIITFATYYAIIMIITATVKVILSPSRESIRLLDMSTEMAIKLNRWFRNLIYLSGLLYFIAFISVEIGPFEAVKYSLNTLTTIYVMAKIIVLSFRAKHHVARWLMSFDPVIYLKQQGSGADCGNVISPIYIISKTWHIVVTIVTLIFGISFIINGSIGVEKIETALLMSLVFIITITLINQANKLENLIAGESLNGTSVAVKNIAKMVVLFSQVMIFVGFLVVESKIAGIDTTKALLGMEASKLFKTLFNSGIAIIIGYSVIKLINITAENYIARLGKDRREVEMKKQLLLILPMFQNLVKALVGVVVFMIVASEFEFNITPILAGFFLFCFAIANGVQGITKDIALGILFIFEGAAGVGDRVKIGGINGRIKTIKLRSIVLVDEDGLLHDVPFGMIKDIINYSRSGDMVNKQG